MTREISLTDESLAIDEIKSVGPGGNFLGNPHTFKHFRNAYYTEQPNRNEQVVYLQ